MAGCVSVGAEREEELPAGEVPQLAPRPQRVSDHVHHDEDRQDGQVSNECLTMFRSSVLYGFLWTFGYYNSTPFSARFMDDLEVFGLLVACLCHDLDHRGTNNSYQTKVGKHGILSGSVNILFILTVNIISSLFWARGCVLFDFRCENMLEYVQREKFYWG